MINHFTALGIPESTDDDLTVKRAYRSKARKHHSDVGGDDAEMARINHAYEVLQRRQGRLAHRAELRTGSPQKQYAQHWTQSDDVPWEPSSDPWDGWPKTSPDYRAYQRARKAGDTWTSYRGPPASSSAEANHAGSSVPTPWVFCVIGGIKDGLLFGFVVGLFAMLGMLVISLVFDFLFGAKLTDLLVLVTCGAALISFVGGTIIGANDRRSHGYR